MSSTASNPREPPQTTGSVIRLVHAALLLQGGGTMAREFWSGHPLERGDGVLSGADLHECVWDESASYPLEWVLRVFGSLESFCLRYGLDYRAFIEDRMLGMNQGSLLAPRSCLRFVGQFLGELLRTPDVRLTLLRLLETASMEIASGLRLRLLRHERSADQLRAWVVLDVGDFGDEVRESDLCSWIALALAHCPRRMGAASFEPVQIVADLRTMDSIATSTQRSEAPDFSNGTWFVNGEPLTRPVSLHGWLERNGISAQDVGSPSEAELQAVVRDWICPLRGRRVLTTGTAYGAPFGLFLLHWSLDDASPAEEALRALIAEALDSDAGYGWQRAEDLHKLLLDNDRHRLRFVYHTGDETISCNGTHLLRGVPAKILQKVLIAHTVTGRTLFEHREFRRDPDLKLDPSNPNLESRLRILAQRLDERLPAVHLAKAGRGRFQLEASVQVEYAEETNT